MQPERDPTSPAYAEKTATRPYGATHSSRIPPSEPGPYADEIKSAARRRPTLTSRVLFYGGAGVIAAAATAAAILAARKLTDAVAPEPGHGPVSGGGQPRERGLAPRFAEMDEDEREEVRRRARERARMDQNRAARLRAMAARERVAPRRNIARDLTETANGLSDSIHGVVGALGSAMAGFRQVAQQASGIVQEFSEVADSLRSLLDRPEDRSRRAATRAEEAPGERSVRMEEEDLRAHDRTHRL